jgi:two-component system NtrC family response regulator
MVLIVDDNEIIGAMLKRTLRHRAVKFVTDGKAAAKIVTKHPFDVVLLDVKLPDGNGIDMIPELHGLAPAARIIVMTNETSAKDRKRALKLGAMGYCDKCDVKAILVAVGAIAASDGAAG